MESEDYIPVFGYEGLYEVNRFGIIKSIDRFHIRGGHKRHKSARVLSQFSDINGYARINLFDMNGHAKQFGVHRIVATSFIPNTYNKPCIDHINTIRTDNRVENLRWCTPKENQNNPITRKNLSICQIGEKAYMWRKFGKLNPASRPVVQFSMNGDFIKEWDGCGDIRRILGFNTSHICSCCRGKRNYSHGYKWSYKN